MNNSRKKIYSEVLESHGVPVNDETLNWVAERMKGNDNPTPETCAEELAAHMKAQGKQTHNAGRSQASEQANFMAKRAREKALALTKVDAKMTASNYAEMQTDGTYFEMLNAELEDVFEGFVETLDVEANLLEAQNEIPLSLPPVSAEASADKSGQLEAIS